MSEFAEDSDARDMKQDNSMTFTENKLFDAMKKIGLNPECQYPISKIHADFAFPEYMLVVEIEPPMVKEHYKEITQRRDFIFDSQGWRVLHYSEKSTWDNPEKIAYAIQKELQNN